MYHLHIADKSTGTVLEDKQFNDSFVFEVIAMYSDSDTAETFYNVERWQTVDTPKYSITLTVMGMNDADWSALDKFILQTRREDIEEATERLNGSVKGLAFHKAIHSSHRDIVYAEYAVQYQEYLLAKAEYSLWATLHNVPISIAFYWD